MRPIDAEALEKLLVDMACTEKTIRGIQMNALCFAAVKSETMTPTIDAVPVVRCKDCQYCRLLNDGVSFECKEWEMDFYAPTYDAATYYCADGKRKEI